MRIGADRTRGRDQSFGARLKGRPVFIAIPPKSVRTRLYSSGVAPSTEPRFFRDLLLLTLRERSDVELRLFLWK